MVEHGFEVLEELNMIEVKRTLAEQDKTSFKGDKMHPEVPTPRRKSFGNTEMRKCVRYPCKRA